MAAAVPVAAATSTTLPAMMSDAAMAAWLPYHDLRATALDPSSLRAVCCDEGRDSLWDEAGHQGRADVCEYLKSKGLLDLIDQRDPNGYTPLHLARSVAGKKRPRGGWWLTEQTSTPSPF